MRRGSALSRPLTTPERTSRRHAPTPLTETESTSSASINPPTVQKCLPLYNKHGKKIGSQFNGNCVWPSFWLISSLKNETSFLKGVHLDSGVRRSRSKHRKLALRKKLLMTAVDQEGHISSLGRGKESRSEQKDPNEARLGPLRATEHPRKDLHRHAPTPLTETESTSSGSINPRLCRNVYPVDLYFAFILVDLITEKRNFFFQMECTWPAVRRESFEVPEAGVEKNSPDDCG
ncbi:hypothetical protein CEXT_313351 [Caerostris extrusa]|uniref:Uncharacterized protein n=1 Tax=Caerostris extrusa TaxID=172846 RepID=A0AAV4Y6B9_CAEEX|nr:hypothetical protein CEXT_313351 [Caerostris extrusa]